MRVSPEMKDPHLRVGSQLGIGKNKVDRFFNLERIMLDPILLE
jgi:hypothetical protein